MSIVVLVVNMDGWTFVEVRDIQELRREEWIDRSGIVPMSMPL